MTSKFMENKSVSQNEDEEDLEMPTFVVLPGKPQHLRSLEILLRSEIYF